MKRGNNMLEKRLNAKEFGAFVYGTARDAFVWCMVLSQIALYFCEWRLFS